jgi:hypothetical protein
MFPTGAHSARRVGRSSHKVGPVMVVLHSVAAVSEAITTATVFHIALIRHCDYDHFEVSQASTRATGSWDPLPASDARAKFILA